MFVSYFKLTEQPFGVTPDPRFLFQTTTHREALASVLYAVLENRGFSALIAPPGMGKTTLLFEILQRCGESVRTVFLFQFQPSPEGLLRNLLSELGEPDDGLGFEAMQDRLNQLILRESKKGKRIVVVVDEAQNFREPVLEVLRMLSNFETSQNKLIHIVLSGQPQLAEMLFSPAIEQLRQRVSIMAVLRPLGADETRDYIDHRLRVAGYRGTRSLFSAAACERIAQYSGGIPRNINNLCFNALSLGYALKRTTISAELVEEVFRDLNLAIGAEAPVKSGPAPSTTTEARHQLAPLPAGNFSAMWPVVPPQPSGRGWAFTAGLISFAAVLCVGLVFAKQYATPPSPINVTLPVPAPPAPQIETTAPVPMAAENAAEPVQADPEPVPAAMKTSRPEPTTRPRATEPEPEHVKLVRISQRQTLYELCTKNLEPCDSLAIHEIQRLNPWLHEASQLEPGEAIRLPLDAPGRRPFSPRFTKHPGDKR